MIEGLERVLEGHDQPGLTELRGLLEKLLGREPSSRIEDLPCRPAVVAIQIMERLRQHVRFLFER